MVSGASQRRTATFSDILCARAEASEARVAYRFLSSDDEGTTLTFGQLQRASLAFAARLSSLCKPGDRAILFYPQGLDFIVAFFGCMHAGVIAVPVSVPGRKSGSETLRGIIRDAGVQCVLGPRDLLGKYQDALEPEPRASSLWFAATDEWLLEQGSGGAEPACQAGDVALLQYTSGSTGNPRGVVITRDNLIDNCRQQQLCLGVHAGSIAVSWLPMFHDMGLGTVVGALLTDIPCTLLAPAAFLQKPRRWLEAISRFRATTSGGPNFAYDLCVQRISPEEREGLDLSSWSAAYSGSEPVRAATLERFQQAFARCGFQREAFRPMYGLAEATLFVTGGNPGAVPVVQRFSREGLTQGAGRADEGPDGQPLVGCGHTWLDTRVVVVDPETRVLRAPGEVGEVWISGPCVADGYWRKEAETRATFQGFTATGEGPYLRSGDLGFLHDGSLFITGRAKDLIIVRGRNHYPEDVEATVSSAHAALEPGRAAAFSIEDDQGEKLVIVQELKRSALRARDDASIFDAMRAAVAQQHGLQTYAIVLIGPATLPRTTSGKVRRRACRQDFLERRLNGVASSFAEPSADREADEAAARRDGEPTSSAADASREPVAREELRAWLVAALARKLGVSPEQVDTRRSFADHGVDSLTGVELTKALSDHCNRPLDETLLWSLPTIEAVVEHLTAPLEPGALPARAAQVVAERKLTRDIQRLEEEVALRDEPARGQVLSALRGARRQLELVREQQTEPIAIVGIGCRLPGGVGTPDALWRLLLEGVDATGDVPPERWNADALYDPDPEAPGKSYVKRGAFLERIDGFDAEFFDISPREAQGMDPQQRLLLEVAWEALEDAGIAPESLRGSATGVWLGLCLDDYARRSVSSGDLSRIDPYTALGNSRSIAAGRIAYVLDLRGPAIQIDTACSSSLVAIDQACRSLRAGETNLALVGGVNLLSSPESMIALCKLRALAPDGRCKTFDAAADGYARGEGSALVVLKRLSDALLAGDRVYAVVRGSATNHDGHSNGITAPSGLAQEAVIRAALAQANVDASAVGYVETHGTGTLLGDPIEVAALGEVYGANRAASEPLLLGTIKSNIGHLEAAAGIVGLVKVALCLAHDAVPPHLHLTQPNPKIPWDRLPVRVPLQKHAWPRSERARLASVSSFGISGTNAHVVVEEAPSVVERAAAASQRATRSAELVVLSAKSPEALVAAAERLRGSVRSSRTPSLRDLAFSLHTTRASLPHRLALAVSSKAALLERLQEVVAAGPVRGEPAPPARPRVVFVFPGQGSQWQGMGRELLREEPRFREAMVACDRALSAELGWSVLEELESRAARLDAVEVVQPLLFAFQVSLAALWRSWGVVPDAVVGHSMGEVAAAVVAGALSLEAGARVTCRRSQLLAGIAGRGEMALVELSLVDAAAAIAGCERELSVAVSNGATSTVLSGEPAALARVLARLDARGVFHRRVKVSVASHSPQVDPLLPELVTQLSGLEPGALRVPMFSTVTGERLEGHTLTARYWADNLRQPVLFARAVRALMAEGPSLFVELSPHPLLVGAVEQLRQDARAPGVAVGSLRREQAERLTLLESLAALHVQGHPLAAERLFPGGGRRLALPTYPWQRQRFWLEATAPVRQGVGATTHPLLGARVPVAGVDALYESTLSVPETPWLSDHRVAGQVVLPAAAIAELLRAAAEDYRQGGAVSVDALVLQAPLVLPESGAHCLQVIVSERGRRAAIHGRPLSAAAEAPWTLHASAELGDAGSAAPRTLDVQSLRRRATRAVDVAGCYSALGAVGLGYGPGFQGLRALWRGANEAVAEIAVVDDLDVAGYGLHPTLLDAALQAVLATLDAAQGRAFLPFEIGRTVVHRAGAREALVHVRLQEASAEGVLAELRLFDGAGSVIAELDGLHLRAADLSRIGQPGQRALSHAFFEIAWPVLAPSAPGRGASGHWLVLGDDDVAHRLARELCEHGARSEAIDEARRVDASGAEHVVCVWESGTSSAQAISVATRALAIAQACATRQPAPRLWWITRESVAVSDAAEVQPSAAAVWGLGRTVMAEHPELACTLIDLDAHTSIVAALESEVAAQDGENQLAWRNGQRHVARLVRAASPALPHADEQQRLAARATPATNGSVLVTGGLGALGLEVARELAARGVPHLVLSGRRGLATPGAADAVARLEALGARVSVAAVDASDRAGLAALLASLPPEFPLRGVVHAAGFLDDGLLAEQTPERIARIMAPKVAGVEHLHELTLGLPLDFFVLFSSLAGSLGSASQSGYAAANAFLDAFAAHRRARGLPALSLAWGPWAERGLAAALDARLQARLTRQGVNMIAPEEGRALFAAALERSEPGLVIASLDLRAATRALAPAIPPLWRALVRSSIADASSTKGGWARELGALPSEQRERAASHLVRQQVARVLSLGSPSTVPEDRPLKELGFDSLMAVELRNAIGRHAGVTLPATLAFDHPTPRAIARYLLGSLKLTDAAAAPAVASTASGAGDDPIAIVGVGCRMPGGVTDLASFWQLLDQGVDAISEVPKERWDIDAWFDPDPAVAGKVSSRWGGFVPGLEHFDPNFFGVSPREAPSIDPQARLLLETAWEALEHAGIAPASLADSSTGVYFGICGNEYQARALARVDANDAYAMLGTLHSTVVGRLSYWLGLKGPNVPIDTACSSSLVAVHLACQALRADECSLAFAGGVSVILGPEPTVQLSRLRALSPTGRCRAFSADADGFVRSDGAGVVILERLSDALARGHRVLGVIRGSAVNQDGRSNGITAPNGPSQQAVIGDALRRARVAPSEVDYVECHGTGTELGDPIEVQALAAALSDGARRERPVLIGSLKSNVGHMEGAAGVGSLIKALLALQHERVPKSLHVSAPNPHVAWGELSVRVAAEAVPWPRTSRPRFAGVSSFGISGTNAHVVLEEAPVTPPRAPRPARSAELIVLTAKSSSALAERAARLQAHVARQPELALADLASALLGARAALEERLAFSVASRAELDQALELARHGETPPGALRARAREARGKVVWLFTGQGAQRPGMGRELYAEWPVFARALDDVLVHVDRELGRPLRPVMWAEPGSAAAALLDQTELTQPALFAIQWALAALWRSLGVEPDLVTGHSLGELSAAAVAGVFSLADAARLVCARGRLMQALPAGGTMLSIGASRVEVEALLAPYAATVAIAAVNAPSSTVISGVAADVAAVREQVQRLQLPFTPLTVSHASHSPLMEPMLEAFGEVVRSIELRPPRLPLVSNLRGDIVGVEVTEPDYWVRHVRQPVLFANGVQALLRAGADTFMELGPRAPLLGLVSACAAGDDVALIASLRSDGAETRALLQGLGSWIARGGEVSREGLFGEGRSALELPSYPWQRTRHWLDAAAPTPKVAPDELEATLRRLLERAALPEAARAALPDILRALSEERALTDARAAQAELTRDAEPASPAAAPSLPRSSELAALPLEQRREGLTRWLQREVARVLSWRGDELPPADRSLKDLGIDSLMAVELRAALGQSLGVALPERLTFDVMLSSCASLAERLHDHLLLEQGDAGLGAHDYERDASLPDTIQPMARAPEAVPRHALLTGATGFLGGFLLAELLERTRARVTCIVRADDVAHGLQRVAQNLQKYGLDRPGYDARIDVVMGDLAAPRLGLDDATYTRLAEQTDAIYNNAAHVSYLADYPEMRPSHIGGTLELLELATRGRPKVFHHVSSLAVYHADEYRGADIPEAAWPVHSSGIRLPYAQCKWVTERLVRAASERGVPAVIYRPADIGGSSQSGAWSRGDFLCRVLRGCIEMGCMAGDIEIDFIFTPVDYVAGGIVELSLRPESWTRAFNLHHPEGMTLRELHAILNALGHDVALVPYAEWLERVRRRRLESLYPLLPFFHHRFQPENLGYLELRQGKNRPRVQSAETVRTLARAGVPCPALDRELIERYVRRF